MASLAVGDYLDLSMANARQQWSLILGRAPADGQRGPDFLPVETLLCFGASMVVNHRSFGGSSSHRAPTPVLELATLFRRTPASILAKLANLDGSRSHGAKAEPELSQRLTAQPALMRILYAVIIDTAREHGIGPDRLPDFLDLSDEDNDLLGYDELLDVDLDKIIAQRVQDLIDSTRADDAVETGRRLEVEIRLGQRRFANDVLTNYERRCAFCGFEPTHLPKRKLLIASHIKPWSKANDRERLDTANGVAACPVHDVAFDQGLITVDNDLNIHRTPLLDASIERDPGVATYFGSPPLRARLLTPGTIRPGQPYVAWHREHVAGMPAA
jgi:putative restriction endonuclease